MSSLTFIIALNAQNVFPSLSLPLICKFLKGTDCANYTVGTQQIFIGRTNKCHEDKKKY